MSSNDKLIGGRYRIQRKLGEGGMATVFLAIDEKLGRAVAIKILHDHMERNEEIRKRFQHEAQAISGLDHPNIVKIYDFSGFDSERLWFVTEIIKGKNLADETEKWPAHMVHPVIATCIVRETCRALAHAHSFGIVHRDIKPENIMITNDGVLKLMDFGIAKIQQKSSVTITGTFMGSPSYMSPEQIRGRNIDHRSDLYSVCVLFYEIVTGKLPFVGQTTHDVIMKIMDGNYSFPRFLAEGLSQEIDSFIVKGMSRNPDQRFSSALEMEKILQRILIDLEYDESQVELQRYFRDPEAYREKVLLHKKKPNQSTMHLTAKEMQFRSEERPKQPIQKQNELAIDHPISKALAEKKYQVDPAAYLKTAHLVQKEQEPTLRVQQPQPKRRDRTVPPQFAPAVTKIIHHQAPAPIVLPPPPRIQVNIGQQQPQQVYRQTPRSFPRVPRRVHVIHRRQHFTVQVPRSGTAGFFALLFLMTVIGGLIWTASESTNIPNQFQNGYKKISRTIRRNKNERKAPILAGTPAPRDNTKVSQVENGETVSEAKPTPSAKPVVTAAPATKIERKIAETKAKPTPLPVKIQPTIAPTLAKETHPESDSASESKKEFEKTEKPEKAERTEKPAPAKVVGDGSIFVSSQPAAEIFWRGRKIGTTIETGSGSGWLKIAAGNQTVELRRVGYQNKTIDVSLKANERKRLGSYSLVMANQVQDANSYFLTVAISQSPAQITIIHLDKNRTDHYTLNTESRVFTLEKGNYEVSVEKDGQKQSRNLSLAGRNTHYTFTARFKKVESEEATQ